MVYMYYNRPCSQVVVTNTYDLMRAARVFLIPKLWPWEENLAKKYGKWAGKELQDKILQM